MKIYISGFTNVLKHFGLPDLHIIKIAGMSADVRTGLLEIPVELTSGTYYLRPYILDSDNILHAGEIQVITVGSASGDSIGEIVMLDMYESALEQTETETETPVVEEPEEPAASTWSTVMDIIMTFIQKVINYIKLALSIIKF